MLHARGKGRSGFTLVELLVSIAIMALLTTLLVPTIDRSLSQNNLANDVDLLRSKLEETRLLAGSTQQADTSTGYYGLLFPGGTNNYVAILRISDDATCSLGDAVGQANGASGSGPCVVERITLSKNVQLENGQGNTDKLVIFRSPTQQVSESHHTGSCLRSGCYSSPDGSPIFSSWDLKLKFKAKTATVTLENYTARLSVSYN